MKKILLGVLAAAVALSLALPAAAVRPGKTVEFDGKGAGKVVFDGKTHREKGFVCGDCHKAGLFQMRKGSDAVTMKDMEAGKFCGACHNGTKAFGVKDAASCSRCHKK